MGQSCLEHSQFCRWRLAASVTMQFGENPARYGSQSLVAAELDVN